ncbi:MAG TPA: SpoIIE family protein phosphatase [Candidatus Acidoferrales bacterium]|nr:SpoIIE family protein phosphatase [Candidatus Acidoferrales bacterium]
MDLKETQLPIEARAAESPVEVSAEAFAILLEIAEEVNSSLDLDHVLQKAAELVRRLVPYEIFAVLLLDEAAQELHFRFAIGYTREVVETWRIPVGKGITGTAAQTRQPVLVGDVRNDPRYLSAVESARSEMAVPLMVKGRAIGVLDIQSRELDSFTREQQQVLALVAGGLASAIENARLYESARGQAETLRVLTEVGREASSILNVEELLRIAADLIKRVIDYQMASILVYDAAEKRFTHAVDVRYGRSEQSKLEIGPTNGIVGVAVSSGRPVRVPDVSADPRYILCNPEARSELAVPMVNKGRVVGVIDLESPVKNYFTEEHVQAVSILAGSLAVAIENARLYQQVSRDEARKDEELQAARSMQGALLPQVPAEDYGLEIAARYVPALEMGGDMYDFLRYGPQQLAVSIGDVAGKGSAAALFGATTVGMLRSLAPQKPAPAEMLRQLNQHITELRVEGRFTTLCFMTWQKGRQRLRIANAGHWQPLLWKDGRCEKIPVAGLPLGIEPDATYDERAYHLGPGDVVVCYSDGITERTNPAEEFYGVERLRLLVAAHHASSAGELADRIFEDAERFAQGVPPADDGTLVVLRVK